MKKTILLFTLILTTGITFSQNSQNNGTTLEEYNYMTKGIEIQLSSGLDMKSGYNIDKIDNIKRGNYSFSFNALLRTEEKELAGILIIANSQVSGRTYYLGMPINNLSLQPYFEDAIRNWDESMTTAFAQALSELYSKTLFSYYDKSFNLNSK